MNAKPSQNGQSVSIGSATSNRITGHTTPARAIADIQSGKWANQVAALRAASNAVQRDNLKRHLPAFLWSGKFKVRKNCGIERFSGLLCADVDKVADRVDELRAIARKDPHVAAAFVSPSGTGIKIVFCVPVINETKQHVQNFDAVRSHIAGVYSAIVDEAAKDVARLCFVSHDPAAFYNAAATPLKVNGKALHEKMVEVLVGKTNAETSGRNNAAFNLACKCRDEGRTQDEAQIVVSKFAAKCNPPLPKGEADSCVKSAFTRPPRPPGIELPDLIDAVGFTALMIEPPSELVAGILHKGSKLVLGGSSKSFKTWSLLDLAISVAAGTDWLGCATVQGKVLFLNFEIQPHPWQRRIVTVAQAKGVELRTGQLILWNLRGHAADFKILIPSIIEKCRAEHFALIVLDPIYKLYGDTDENSAGNVALLLNALETLAAETGAAIAFGAHFAKGNASAKEAIDRISGSGVFARDPDSILIFTKHQLKDAFTVEPILRNFAPVAPFVVRWQFPLMHRADGLDPDKLKKFGGRPAKHSPQDLLTLLPPDGFTHREWIDAAKSKDIRERTFYRLRDDLEKANKIVNSITAGKWMPIEPKTKP